MVFTNGDQRVFYRTMLGVTVMIMQQLTGINLITYELPLTGTDLSDNPGTTRHTSSSRASASRSACPASCPAS